MILANLMFAAVASTGHSVAMLTLAVGTENLFAAISLTVFATYLAGLSNTAFTATQYALLSSVAAVARTFATTPSGYAATAFGWPGFYVFCGFLAIPGLFFLWLMQRAGFVVETVRRRFAVRERERHRRRDHAQGIGGGQGGCQPQAQSPSEAGQHVFPTSPRTNLKELGTAPQDGKLLHHINRRDAAA